MVAMNAQTGDTEMKGSVQRRGGAAAAVRVTSNQGRALVEDVHSCHTEALSDVTDRKAQLTSEHFCQRHL